MYAHMEVLVKVFFVVFSSNILIEKNLVFLRFIWSLEGLERSGRPVARFPPIFVENAWRDNEL